MEIKFDDEQQKDKWIKYFTKEVQANQFFMEICQNGKVLIEAVKPRIATSEEWYEVYPRKVDPDTAKARYSRLSDKDKLLCMERTRILRSLTDKGAKELQFIKGAPTFISKKGWKSPLDEGASQIRNPAYEQTNKLIHTQQPQRPPVQKKALEPEEPTLSFKASKKYRDLINSKLTNFGSTD